MDVYCFVGSIPAPSVRFTEVFLAEVLTSSLTTSLIDLTIVEKRLNDPILLFHAIDTIIYLYIRFSYLMIVWLCRSYLGMVSIAHCFSLSKVCTPLLMLAHSLSHVSLSLAPPASKWPLRTVSPYRASLRRTQVILSPLMKAIRIHLSCFLRDLYHLLHLTVNETLKSF